MMTVKKNRTLRTAGLMGGLGIAMFFNAQSAMAAQATVALASAVTFGVLAGSPVTSSGGTVVKGDLGVSPGTSVTGAPTVTAFTHLGDPVAAQAQFDLNVAYNDAAGRTDNAITVSGNLGGLTLAPGLYKSQSSLAVSSGDLTLDGQGDTNGVWIFQMGSTLTTTSGRQVILVGGAQAANIFWVVGSSATLGTTSVFKGTIMADQAITLQTGAALEGRALARVAGVALDANTITVPNTVTLVSALTLTNSYIYANGQSVDPKTGIITSPVTGDKMRFYRLRASSSLKATSIRSSGTNVVITYQ